MLKSKTRAQVSIDITSSPKSEKKTFSNPSKTRRYSAIAVGHSRQRDVSCTQPLLWRASSQAANTIEDL